MPTMPSNDIVRLSLTEMGAAIERRELSSVEAAAACLSRLEGEGERLGCVAGADRDQALNGAEAADEAMRKGRRLGPLHGVPLAHKDMFFRAGRRTECGSRILAGHRPTVTATVLTRLDQGGALDIARLAMSEFAIGPMGHNPITGTPRNPWNEAHLAGGTSSGPAAAVAARIVPGALASDTGGSARLPAAFCGVVGLKPSCGRVSRFGMFPVSATLDHVGILTRTVADGALLFAAVAGYDPKDPTSSRSPVRLDQPGSAASLAGLRIGVPLSYFLDDLDSVVARLMDGALDVLKSLGARLVPVDLPGAEIGNPMASLIIMVEAATVHRRWMSERPGDYAPETLARLETGTHYAAADYRLALCARAELLGRIGDTVFDRVDLLVTPTATVTAPRIDGADLPAGSGFADLVGPVGRCLRLFNVTGLPALALPAGLSANGLPASIQLVGRPYDEATILRVGAAYEEAVGGFAAPPPRPITPDRQRGST